MVQLNLLPDVKKEFIRARRVRNNVIAGATIVSLASIGLLVVFALSIYVGQRLYIDNLTSRIERNESALKQVKEVNKYLTVQNQLEHIDPLHSEKLKYSRLMDFLLTLNPSVPNNIQLDTLELSQEDSTVVFKGTAPSAQAFNIYKDTLDNAKLTYSDGDGKKTTQELFSDVIVESSVLGRVRDQTRLTFIINAEYHPDAFAADTDGPTVSVPNMQTTQSVRNAPLFNSEAIREGAE